MAKGTATCTCKRCGKNFEAYKICRNRAEASSWETWATEHYTECSDCREQRREEERNAENAASASAAADRGWSVLTGTEKQIAWANTIREKEMTPILQGREHIQSEKPDMLPLYDYCIGKILNHTSAHWWIDNRDDIRAVWAQVSREALQNPNVAEQSKAEADAAAAAKNEEATIAAPEDRQHEGVVDISAADTQVSAKYARDEAFRQLVKELGYRWDADKRIWYLPIDVKSGAAEERAAELGNKLLNAGFAIRIQNPETLKNAIAGNYEPMCRRWITRVSTTDTFAVSWAREDDLYHEAKSLPRARYRSPDMHCPGSEYLAVLDFAELYGFKLSPGALGLVEEMRGNTVTVVPAAAKKPAYDEHPVLDILSSSREVLDDLKD